MHRRSRHAAGSGEPRGRAWTAPVNELGADNWQLFASHRARLSALAVALQRTEGLCVLGAGNCDDLDLPLLIEKFRTVHLVDLDDAALGRGVARLPQESQRQRAIRHGGVELAVFADQFDAWEKSVPELDGMATAAATAASATVAAIGAGPFDVVLSSCVLTQLWVPAKRAMVLTAAEWKRVFAVVGLAHMLTMVGLTRPGGSAALVTEVGQDGEPDLQLLLRLLREHPLLSGVVEGARLVDPWPWDLKPRTLPAHALVFRRTDASGEVAS